MTILVSGYQPMMEKKKFVVIVAGEGMSQMPRKKKIEVVEEVDNVVDEQAVEQPHVVQHTDRWDSGTNHLVSESLPSLDD